MSGFSNSLVAGIGTLIREYIRSPDYVAGVSGWTINKDGSVEFNNGVFRGTITDAGMFIYNGVPAAGNLIISISPTTGTDSFGNTYPQGMSFNPDFNPIGGLSWAINKLVGVASIFLEPNNPVAGQYAMHIDAETLLLETSASLRLISSSSTGGDGIFVKPGLNGGFTVDTSNSNTFIQLGANSSAFRLDQWNRQTAAISGLTRLQQPVVFGAAFPVGSTPFVQAQPEFGSNNDIVLNTNAITNTGFNATLATRSGVAATVNGAFTWRAWL